MIEGGSEQREKYERAGEIGRLWSAHEKTLLAQNEMMNVLVGLKSDFHSFEESYKEDKERNRKPHPLIVAGLLISSIVPLCAVLWLFIEVRISPVELVTEIQRKVEEGILTDLDEIDKQHLKDSYTRGQQDKEAEWLSRLALQLRADRDALKVDVRGIDREVGEIAARQEWLMNWLTDVDKEGSRRWIGIQQRRDRHNEQQGE